jgi:CRP-like cAMP-binding protein
MKKNASIDVTAETLGCIDVFRGLPREVRSTLAEQAEASRYSADQQVVSHRDDSTDVFFIVSGELRVTVYALSGREVSFKDLGAGEMFGELAAIDGQPRTTHVIALTDSVVASMSAAAFWQTIHAEPELAAAVLKRLARLVRSLSERVIEISTLGVNNRIHAELLRLARQRAARDDVAEIEPAPTHADIAARISSHREAVSRELKRLERIGLIEWRPGRHRILDLARLEQMVKEVRGD